MTTYTRDSINNANQVAFSKGEYLCGEFEDTGDYGWETSFGDYTFISKEDIEVLYFASKELDELGILSE